MTGDQLRRVHELFDEALQRPPEERTAFLAQACGDDAELRTEVESLLDYDSRASDDFLRPPEGSPGLHSLAREAAAAAEDSPLIGKRVGRYHVKSVIAVGGMATVYEAVQESPHRVVALKVMHPNVASRSSLRRFQFESQVLARLRHRGIGQVYEAGVANVEVEAAAWAQRGFAAPDVSQAPTAEATSSRLLVSVAYFAMEYIPGARPITQYAVEKQLDTRQRLELFARVCEAVHHGHQKGVIHRDLKPANILVDSAGEPKVIDFGVARATDSDLAITTQQTNIGQLVGTMQYMSPEQCDADPHGLDTRSDVYSLGVVLYELLTGQLPYEASRSTIYQAARVIKEQAPRRLSASNRRLRGDVETIVLKALEKDREKRYASAADLAQDIRHYLAGEAISVRPPRFIYLLGKIVEQHKWQTATVLAGSLLVVAGIVALSVWRWAVEADSQRHRAEGTAYGASMVAAEAALRSNAIDNARVILERTDRRRRGWEWRHLFNRLDQSLETIVSDLEGGADHLAVSADGRLLAVSPNNSGTLVVIDLDSRQRSRVEHRFNTTAVALSPDGRLLAGTAFVSPEDHRGVIRIWEIAPQGRPRLAGEWIAHRTTVSSLTFHPTAPLLASASEGELKLWNLRKREKYAAAGALLELPPEAALDGHRDAVVDLAFHPAGDLLASAGWDYTVRLWRLVVDPPGPSATELAVLRGHTYYVDAVAFSRDGRRLASGSVDRTIRLWDVEACLRQAAEDAERNVVGGEAELAVLYGHEGAVTSLAFDPEGRLVSASGDRTIRVWELNEQAIVPEPDRVQEWKARRYEQIASLCGHAGPVHCIASLPDGRIVSVCADRSIKCWLPDLPASLRLRGHISSVRAVAFTPDGRHLVSSGAEGDQSFLVWDCDLGVPVARRYTQDLEGIWDVACWALDGHVLLACATGHDDDPSRAPGHVSLWDLSDASHPRRLWSFPNREAEPSCFTSVAVSGAGTHLAASDTAGRVRIWSIGDTGSPTLSLVAELTVGGRVLDLEFVDPAGRWLVVTSRVESDRSLLVWDVESAQAARSAHYPGASAQRLALNLQRNMLASALADGTIRLWSVEWGAGMPRLRDAGALSGHTEPVMAVAFHPSEPRLASGSADRTIKIWDTQTLVEVATLRGPAGTVHGVAFDPAGERLASTSGGHLGEDNVVWLWETDRVFGTNPAAALHDRAAATRAHEEVRQVMMAAVPSLEAP